MLYATVAEIEHYLSTIIKWSKYDYLQDHHFAQHIAKNITPSDIQQLIERLLSECENCTKARVIQSYLNGDGFWSKPKNYSSLLAYVRRIHCWSHESGSFALRP